MALGVPILKHFRVYIVVYLVKMFAIAAAFQEFAFIIKWCPFVSTFGARILTSRSYTQKKIPLVFRT